MQDGGSKLARHAHKWLEYSPKHLVARYLLVWALLWATVFVSVWFALSARAFRLAKSVPPVQFGNETWMHLDSDQLGAIPHSSDVGVWCKMKGAVLMECTFHDEFRHIDFALVGNVDHGYHYYIQCELFGDSDGNTWVWPRTCLAWADWHPHADAATRTVFVAINHARHLFRAYAYKMAAVAAVSLAATYVSSFAVDWAVSWTMAARKKINGT